MYFGKIDLRTSLTLLINTILILLTLIILNNWSNIGPNSILVANGYHIENMSGFKCYVKEISSVKNNLHRLTYIQYIPEKQLEQGNITDFCVGIKVSCGDAENGKSYVIYDKDVDERHKHCELCHRYLGEELVKSFNDKENVRLQEVKTNTGKIFTIKVIIGLCNTLYVITLIGTVLLTMLKFIQKKQLITENGIKNCKMIYKSFTIMFSLLMIYCLISSILSLPT